MREEVLRKFFEGKATAAELAHDLKGSTRQLDAIASAVTIEDMNEEFTVAPEMAVRLCDAVLSGELRPTDLETIGFALMASDKFGWDGDEDDVLAEAIADWSAPEINLPLTLENVQKFRGWLTRAEPYPPRPTSSATGGNIISVRAKRHPRSWRRLFRRQ